HPPATPNSTLFPYTTLFRSKSSVSCFLFRCLFITPMPPTGHLVTQHHFDGKFPVVGWPLLAYQSIGWCDTLMCLGKFLEKRFIIDRKSTRLNSSHQIISYAV